MSMKYLNDSTDPCQISTYKKILLCSPAGSVLLSTTAGGACLFVIIYVGWCEDRVSIGLGAGGQFYMAHVWWQPSHCPDTALWTCGPSVLG